MWCGEAGEGRPERGVAGVSGELGGDRERDQAGSTRGGGGATFIIIFQPFIYLNFIRVNQLFN